MGKKSTRSPDSSAQYIARTDGFFIALAAIAALLTAFASQVVGADELVLKTIELKHRSGADVLDVVKPLLDADSRISADGNQLIIRADSSTLEHVETLVAEIDRVPRRLLVTVEHYTERSVTVRGPLESEPSATASPRTQVRHSGDRDNRNLVQQLQMLEGQEAFIRTGKQIPLKERSLLLLGANVGIAEQIDYRDVTSGFVVSVHLLGEEVLVDIAPFEQFAIDERDEKEISLQNMASRVRARLDEWIELSRVAQEIPPKPGAIVRSTTRRDDESHRVRLKISALTTP